MRDANNCKPELIEASIQSILDTAVEAFVKYGKYTEKSAIELIKSTVTYKLLIDVDTGLFCESPYYMFEMLIAELTGDEDKWLKYVN